jgi:hypothetical protein
MSKSKVSKKPKEGRPTKYQNEFPDQAYKLCLLGATDAMLADFFEVCVDTINEWKKVYPEFSASIKRGKYSADSNIANSLYNRAMGMTITIQQAVKITTRKQGANKQITQTEGVEIVSLKQEIPPDTTAGIFWLKNRQPKEWRDKQEVEHSGELKTVSETKFTIKSKGK